MGSSEKQKIALVTGGSSGIGLAIAEKMINKGIKVVIVGRDPDKLTTAAEKLGPNCHTEQSDLSRLGSIPSLVHGVQHKFGRIDILVNNAGIHLKKPMEEVSDEEYKQVIETNQVSVFSLSREVAKIMLQQKSGAIINISSMASRYGLPNVIGYSAAKSAVEGMTRAMAVELSPHGIRVNCVAPGFIETEMSSGAFNNDPERKKRVLERTPARKLGQPGDVANAVYFLSSDEATFITGTILPVDGGNSIGF
jgi:NAD(P)-dependent dehydrogenase (short-subunit alcohol dehydrogenase family)